MIFLRDKFFVLNALKNLLIFSISIFIFLSVFDYFFTQEITWTNNLFQGIFLAAIMLALLTYTDFKKIDKFSADGKDRKAWQRYYLRNGVLEINTNEILVFLNQNKHVDSVNRGKADKMHFRFQVNRYLPAFLGDISVVDNNVTVTFTNNGFFHFGAATAINLFIFLRELELYYESQ